MAGSRDSRAPRDEPGRLIRFPGSGWVPEDGVEPLNGEPLASDSATATAERTTGELETFEPDDFWESGDTQQFVGGGGRRSVVEEPQPTPTSPDVSVPPPAGADDHTEPPAQRWREEPSTKVVGWLPRLWTRRRSFVPVPATPVAAAVVVVALGTAGAVIASLVSSPPRGAPVAQGALAAKARAQSTGLAPIIRAKRVVPAWVSHRPARHVHRVIHRRVTSPTHATETVASASSSSEPTSSVPTHQATSTAEPSAQAVAASGDTASSSGAQHRGPSGPVSLIGAGTSPSG